MIVYLARHGEKLAGNYFNPALRHQDEPLTERGQRQAAALAALLAASNVQQLVISQYLRTAETARPLAARLLLTPGVDARANELDSGLLDGLTEAQVRERYPDVWAALTAHASDFRFPEGETGAETAARMLALLDDVRQGGRDAAILCHEGIIRTTLCAVLGMPVWFRYRFKIDFCGVSALEWHDDGAYWRVLYVNRTAM